MDESLGDTWTDHTVSEFERMTLNWLPVASAERIFVTAEKLGRFYT